LLILSAYLLLSMEKLSGQSLLYQGMNVLGAAGFVVNGWWHGAIPSASLNVIWMLIGGFALLRILKRRRTKGYLNDRTAAAGDGGQGGRRL
jgi:hypothetical protein